MIVLENIRVEAGAYISRLGKMALAARWWLLAIPFVLAVAVGAAFGSKWGLAVAVLGLAAVPMLLSLAYLNYAFSPEARWSILAKDILIDAQGVRLQFADGRLSPKLIAKSEFSHVGVTSSHLLLIFKTPRFTFLMIPFEQLDEQGIDIKTLVKSLYAFGYEIR